MPNDVQELVHGTLDDIAQMNGLTERSIMLALEGLQQKDYTTAVLALVNALDNLEVQTGFQVVLKGALEAASMDRLGKWT